MIKLLKDIVLIFAINILLSDQYTGYLKIVEASFCMDECSHYFLETEQGSYISNISFIEDINPELYINRFVEIVVEVLVLNVVVVLVFLVVVVFVLIVVVLVVLT